MNTFTDEGSTSLECRTEFLGSNLAALHSEGVSSYESVWALSRLNMQSARQLTQVWETVEWNHQATSWGPEAKQAELLPYICNLLQWIRTDHKNDHLIDHNSLHIIDPSDEASSFLRNYQHFQRNFWTDSEQSPLFRPFSSGGLTKSFCTSKGYPWLYWIYPRGFSSLLA